MSESHIMTPPSAADILLVDASGESREWLAALLREAGYKVRTAADGETALSSARRQPPALVLLALGLPGQDGGEVCRRLKAEARPREIPIIVVAPPAEAAHKVQGFAAGADDFIGPPFERAEVLARVATHLKVNRQARELEQLHRQYATFIENLGLGFYRATVDGIVLDHNAEFARLLGWDAAANLRGKSAAMHWCNPADHQAYLTELRTQGQVNNYPVSVRKSQGEQIEILLQARLLRDPDGRPSGIEGTALEITERRRMEAAFRRSDERFRHLSAIATEGIMIHAEGVILEANQAFATLVGAASPEALIGQHGLAVIPLTPASQQRIRDHLRHRTTATFDVELVRPDGRLLPAETHGRDILYQGRNARLVYMRDITERKRVEEALQQSEQKFSSIVEASPMGIHMYSLAPEGQLLFTGANPAADRLLGVDNKQFIGKTIEEAFPPLAKTEIPASYKAAAGEGKNWHSEQVVYEDAQIRGAFEVYAFQTSPGKMVALFQDITERKRTQEALRESEALYQSLVDQLPQCVFRKDRAGRFTFGNRRFCELVGTSPDDLRGRTDFDLFPRELAEKYRRDDVRVMASGQVWTDIEQHRPPGAAAGRFVEIVKWPLYTTAGEVAGVQGIFWDVTERHQAAEALRASEARLIEAQRLAHLGSWETELVSLEDLSQNRLVWSDETFRIFGYEPGAVAVTRQHFNDRVHPDDRPKVQAAVQASLRERQSYQVEHRVVRPDGSERCVLEQAELVCDPATGRPLRLIGTVQDITERKQAEAEKEKLQAQLLQSQKMESVGRLAGGVAHDFNNMLNVIIGHAELALQQAPPGHPLHPNLTEVKQAALRSADLTHRLLAFARKQTVSPKVLDLNDTVAGMLAMLQRLIGEDIALVWRPARELWPVKMDPGQIDQILANLCVNARDAIAGVGQITIETATAAFDAEDCATRAGSVPGEFVALVVSDNGCGMTPETLAHLFEPFFTTKATGKGTGLGLATVYGIVKQNNGFIQVYSEPGLGSTFKLYLPRHLGKAEPLRPESPAPVTTRGQETVLLVEDETAILSLIQTALDKLGYRVLAAATPAEAFHLAERHTGDIQLLITDVVMPEMNGCELAKKLLALYPNLKRLFMSGYTADIIAPHGLLDEGVDFLPKPFSVNDLAEKVRAVLDKA